MVDTGYARTLELEDLVHVSKEDRASELLDKWKKSWSHELVLSQTWADQIGSRLSDDNGKKGTLKWVGRLPYSVNPSAWYAGVEWDELRREEKIPDNNKKPMVTIGGDGWFYGERYFDCKEGHGSFIKPHLLTLDSGKPVPKTPWITWGLSNAFGKEIALAGIYKLGNDITIFAGPLALQAIIDYLNRYQDKDKSDPPLSEGMIIVGVLFASQVIQSLCVNQYFYHSARVGMKLKQCLSAAIFDHALKLNEKTRANPDLNTGRIVNMMSTDAQRANDVMNSLHTLWSAPLQIIVSAVLLYRLVNVALFAGIGVMVFTSPLQGRLMRKMMTIREQMAKFTDERIKTVTEVLSGIRVIKFMGWDRKSEKQVTDIRTKEVDKLAHQQNLRVVMFSLIYMTPIMLAATTFIVYACMGYSIEPSVVFPSMSLFSILRFPFLILPLQFNMMVNAKVSFDRMTTFLESLTRDQQGTYCRPIPREHEDSAFVVKNGEFHAYEPQVIPTLAPELVQLTPERIEERKAQQVSVNVNDSSAANNAPARGGNAKKPAPKKAKKEVAKNKMVPKTVLQDVNLKIRKNRLTMIVGATGSGKTCLLESILGNVDSSSTTELYRPGHFDQDNRFVGDAIAYSQQQAWIMNTTLKNNILFFANPDEDRYAEVVDKCQLTHDLAQLQEGDSTEIGEKGVNLSGGQKQRVSIARAVYSDREVTVLDDPLSAVDPHVGLSLMKKVIGSATHEKPDDWPSALLEGKTRVLVTHQIHFLKFADDVIYLRDGRIAASLHGSPENPILDQLLRYDGEGADFFSVLRAETSKSPVPEKQAEEEKDEESTAVVEVEKVPTPSTGKGKLIKQEERAQGSVKSHMYFSYVKAGGGWSSFALMMVLFGINQAGIQMCDLFLTWWSDGNDTSDPDKAKDAPGQSLSKGAHIAIYAGLILTTCLVNLCRGFFSYSRFQRASRSFHENLVVNVLKAPMSFFDTTPLGRIINRFSRDIDQIDVVLPPTVITFFQMIISVIAYVIVIAAGQQIMLALLVPGAIVYYFILRRFIRTNRETKRLDSIYKSPLFQHFTETLTGVNTITSYSMQEEFLKENRKRIDLTTRTSFANIACNRWLAIRLELLGNIIACATALFAVLSPEIGMEGSIGLLSLGIVYSMSLTSQLSFLVRQVADLEAQMNGVERIVEFSEEIDQEPTLQYDTEGPPTSHFRGQQYLDPDTNEMVVVTDVKANKRAQGEVQLYSPNTDEFTEVTTSNFEVQGYSSVAKKPVGWPHDGRITFTDVHFRYRPGLPLVLNGLGGPRGLVIESGDRIGVVGRTGAGKSTVMLALFRLVEIAGGSITIGGRDLRTLKLEELRSSISMIPQDPVLFQGTVRSNLDPFNTASDDEIWRCLSQVNMRERLEAHDDGLDGSVTQGGQNFSVGQRQLLCMARALLKSDSRILLMDEATASIDHATDTAIQKTVREQFKDYTVLTVAHRLQTIMDSTRIMVLDKGTCAEYDTPSKLLNDTNSLLYGMAQQTGSFDHLKDIASGTIDVCDAIADADDDLH
eukprot:TRINITY_DN7348_c2_g1_i1.p1 TRINITY_DN7348_c2_g1~~TRINITY_DN7348_c2_g1_i1.p1  ORF type:complete len:1598 (+),score=762.92 TRINITY_DN7348_c2_g1_i1:195-4796(+)